MSEQNKVLLHALLMAASDPRASREALEELAALGDDPDRLAELTGSAPQERTIGKRRRSFVTKSHKSKASGADDEDGGAPGADLARWYARWFDALEESGLEPTPDDIAEAEAELDGSGWSVGRDDSGDWRARPTATTLKKSCRRLDKAAQRAPAGFTRTNPFHFNGRDYVGGQFIPGKAVESASPADREKLAQAKESEDRSAEAKKQARGSQAVDLEALKRSVAPAHGLELTAPERGNAARAYAALKRHHGGLTLHRVAELAGKARQALDAVGDDHPNAEGLRDYWSRQLAAIASWVGRAEGEGMTGEAAVKPATEEAAAKPDPYDGLGGMPRGDAEAKAREYWASRKESRGQAEPRPPADPGRAPDPKAREQSANRVRARNVINGGEFGPNGEFYPAGTFFNLTEDGKRDKAPPGAGGGLPAAGGEAKEESGIERMRREDRERADAARKQHEESIQAIKDTPLGGLTDLGNSLLSVKTPRHIDAKPWRAFAEAVGPAGLKKLLASLEPRLGEQGEHERDLHFRDPQMLAHALPKTHQKQHPDSARTYATLNAYLSGMAKGEIEDDLLAVGQLLASLDQNGLPYRSPRQAAEDAQGLAQAARGAGLFPNKFPGRTDSGKKVAAGEGFVRRRPDGTFETLTVDEARSIITPKAGQADAAPTPPDPHFTGTRTDVLGRTYQFVDGVRVGTDDPASLSENSLDSGDAPGNNAPVDAQPREEPTMPESNETPAAPTPEAAPAPAVNLDDYDHIEGTLKDTPRGRVLEAGEGGLGRQFGRAEIPGLKGHTFAHGGKLWKVTAVGNKFERGRGSYRYLYVEPVGDHGPAPAPEPTPPAPAAVAAESGLAPLVAPPGGDYRGYLESVDATRPATLARLREQGALLAEQWPEKAADMARMAELLPTISDPAFWVEAGKRSAAMVLNILKRRPEWGVGTPPPASPAAGPRQPWEMTREEFRASTEKQGRYSHEEGRRRAEQEISRAERDKAEAEARGFPAGHFDVAANRWRAELARLGEYAPPTEDELGAAYRRVVEAARKSGDPVPDDAYGRFGVTPPAAPAPRTPAPQPAPQRVAAPAPVAPAVKVSAPEAPATAPEPKRPHQMSLAEYAPTHSPAPGKHRDPRLAHWFSIQEALEAGEEVAPAALADHDHYYSHVLAKRELQKPAAPLVRSVPVRTGRKTLEIRMPPQGPDGVTDRGGGKFQLRRGQDFGTGGFATYEPGMVIRHGASPLIVERAGKPYVARHNGEPTGYYQDVDARPPTAEEAAAVARLEAAEEAAEYRRRIADAAGVAPQGTESLRRVVAAYQAALARMNA